jgi:hypothetical protein
MKAEMKKAAAGYRNSRKCLEQPESGLASAISAKEESLEAAWLM